MMPRMFVADSAELGQTLVVDGDAGHHFARVLRAKPGEPVVVVCQGTPFLGTICACDPGAGVVRVELAEVLEGHEPSVEVVIVQGLAKGDKIEDIMQKCTEAGASGFIVVATERSVVRFDDKKAQDRLIRWQRQVQEAASQSQRDMVPNVAYHRGWDFALAALAESDFDMLLMLDESDSGLGLGRALRDCEQSQAAALGRRRIGVLVGPEGGWSDDERNTLVNQLGVRRVTLGPRIFRTETAGLAALCMILYDYGDMGGR